MKDPAFLFYSSDFLSGVADLTMDERGQYITLLCLQHQKGNLNEKTIMLNVGNVSADVLKKFEKDEFGNYFNERLRIETEKRNKFTESRRNNGNLGGRPKEIKEPKENLKDNLMVMHKDNLMGNENKDENIDIKETEIKENKKIEKTELELLIENFNTTCISLPKVLKLTDARIKTLNARIKEYSIDEIKNIFKLVSESNFLNGENDKVWTADFDWILNPNNFIKIKELKYKNNPKSKPTQPHFVETRLKK